MVFRSTMRTKSLPPAATKTIGYAFTLIAFAYFLKHAYSSFDEISAYEWSLGQFIIILFSASLIILIGFLSGVAWHFLLKDQGASTSFRTNLSILCTSQIAKYIPGNVGQYFGRIYFSRKNGIPLGTITLSMVIETIWLIFIAATLSVITFLLFKANKTTPAFLGNTGFIQLLLITFICFIGPILLIRLTRLVAQITGRHEFGKLRLPNLSISLKIWAIDLAIFVIHGLLVSIHIMLFSNGSSPDMLLNTVLYATVWLAGYIFPGAPAGLGVREAATFAIFTNFYDASTCIAISISLRIASIIGDVLTYAIGSQLKKP